MPLSAHVVWGDCVTVLPIPPSWSSTEITCVDMLSGLYVSNTTLLSEGDIRVDLDQLDRACHRGHVTWPGRNQNGRANVERLSRNLCLFSFYDLFLWVNVIRPIRYTKYLVDAAHRRSRHVRSRPFPLLRSTQDQSQRLPSGGFRIRCPGRSLARHIHQQGQGDRRMVQPFRAG